MQSIHTYEVFFAKQKPRCRARTSHLSSQSFHIQNHHPNLFVYLLLHLERRTHLLPRNGPHQQGQDTSATDQGPEDKRKTITDNDLKDRKVLCEVDDSIRLIASPPNLLLSSASNQVSPMQSIAICRPKLPLYTVYFASIIFFVTSQLRLSPFSYLAHPNLSN